MADGTFEGILPPPTLLSGTVGALLSAPAITLVAGANGAVLSAPAVTLSASDYPAARLSVPAVTLSASMGFAAALSAPAPTLAATGITGSYNTVAEVIPAPTLVATLYNPAVMSVVLAVPPPILTAASVAGNILTLAQALPAPTIAASGFSGNTLTAALSAVAPVMAAVGYPAYTLTFANSVPAPQISTFLATQLPLTFRTWVLNTRKGALTEYNNFPFNSFTVFNGQVLACGAGGVVVLGTQALDGATAISAKGRTGKSDYNRSLLKRVPRIYMDYQSDGDMIMRTIVNESGTRSYSLPTNHVVGFQQRRVPIGRGPKSTYWAYEFENVAGSDFSVQAVLAYPITLRRRIM